MFVGDFPGAVVFYEDHGGAGFLFDDAGSGFETVVENEGRDSNVAEEVDFEVVGAHREAVGGGQSVVFAFASDGGVLAVGRFRAEFCEPRAVKVVALQARQVFFHSGIDDLVQAKLDLPSFHRVVWSLASRRRGAAGEKERE